MVKNEYKGRSPVLDHWISVPFLLPPPLYMMMKKNNLNTVSNFVANYSVRTAQKDGKTHLVIPIVALIEGVHCGSVGCAFYPSGEIEQTAQQWNGVPLTGLHPHKGGELVLVKDALKEFKIGTFENVRFENGKLNGEGWVDIELAESVSPESLQMIRSGINMEVSTGLRTHPDGQEGTWNGEHFDQSLFDFLPDHLALLPDEEGACSLKDGCGVRMNTKKECGTCKLNIHKGGRNGMKLQELSEFCVVDNIIINGDNLAATLNKKINQMVTEERSRTDIIQAIANAAGISSITVNQILGGSINCPPLNRLQGFSKILKISVNSMITSARRDGCEYETNNELVVKNKNKGGGENVSDKEGVLYTGLSQGVVLATVIKDLKGIGYWVNELSHSKLREKLNKIVDDMDKPGVMHFLRDPFNEHFIFQKVLEAENDSKLFKQKFSINKDDEIRLRGDPVEVTENITFPEVKTNKGGDSMANSKEQVDALITNDKLEFTKEDAAWLEDMDKEHFGKLYALNECNCTEALEKELVEANGKIAQNVELVKKLEEKITANESQAKEKANYVPTFEEVLGKAPLNVQDAIQNGMKINQEKRDKLIGALVGNDRCHFTKEALESKNTQELEDLVDLGSVAVDYSLKGNGGQKVYGANEKHPNGYGVPIAPRFEDWPKDLKTGLK